MVSTKYSGTVTHMPPELIEDGKVYQQVLLQAVHSFFYVKTGGFKWCSIA
jgi:hypothetical protein